MKLKKTLSILDLLFIFIIIALMVFVCVHKTPNYNPVYIQGKPIMEYIIPDYIKIIGTFFYMIVVSINIISIKNFASRGLKIKGPMMGMFGSWLLVNELTAGGYATSFFEAENVIYCFLPGLILLICAAISTYRVKNSSRPAINEFFNNSLVTNIMLFIFNFSSVIRIIVFIFVLIFKTMWGIFGVGITVVCVFTIMMTINKIFFDNYFWWYH
ncbi:hypothetical protein [Fructilactobacillus sanfranciscensis]|uniref:hypothetical protein n=1 Tax=Fructilactobacillus sanfranciscensis TaxID=1625 RepID=UPI00111B4C57|nr:hypothetical protein [Fructilactobacillus sanfranciscensis]TNK96729.1 hypothetical protein DKP75_06940 [Fructilactobacillus sanfranciscensis]